MNYHQGEGKHILWCVQLRGANDQNMNLSSSPRYCCICVGLQQRNISTVRVSGWRKICSSPAFSVANCYCYKSDHYFAPFSFPQLWMCFAVSKVLHLFCYMTPTSCPLHTTSHRLQLLTRICNFASTVEMTVSSHFVNLSLEMTVRRQASWMAATLIWITTVSWSPTVFSETITITNNQSQISELPSEVTGTLYCFKTQGPNSYVSMNEWFSRWKSLATL